MAINRAAWLMSKQERLLKVDSAPMPEPQPHEIVIKTHAVAMNPVDAMIQSTGLMVDKFPYVGGIDVAGQVTRVGSDVTRFKVGDRVIAMAYSPSDRPNMGSFQLYCAAEETLTVKLPENVSYTEGSVLPLALCTAAVGLFQKDTLALDYPQLDPKPTGKVVLIWGASSSVGSCAVQMAKAAGYDVAATASSHNFEYVRSLGADYVFDHKSEAVVEDIVKALKGKESAGAFDTVMPPDTMLKCGQIVNQLAGNKFVETVVPPPAMAPMAFPIPELPEGVKVGYCDGNLKNSEVGPAVLGTWLSPALARSQMKCKPDAQVVGHGLESVQEALVKMSAGVSAAKLVVEIA